MLHKRLVAAAIAVAICSLGVRSVHAQESGKAPAPDSRGERSAVPAASDVATWTLGNGLTVAFARRSASPQVSVQLWVRAGTREETKTTRGVARLFEHLMFSGSTRVRAGDHRRFIESVGGFSDGFVIEDAAAFNDTVPAQHLDLALELGADRLGGLLLRPVAIDDAKARVKEAIRRSMSSAFFRALVQFLGLAYTAHPYGVAANGSEAEVDRLTTDAVRAFYRDFYAPSNALLVVVGDVELASVRSAVERHYGKLDKRESAAGRAKAEQEPAQTEAKREEGDWPASVGFVVAGYHIPAAAHEDIYALQLASLLLARAETGRLRKRFDSDKSVRGAAAEALVREHPGLFVSYAAFSAGADAAAIEKALLAELDKLATTAPSAAELDRAKNHLASTLSSTIDTVTGLARQIGQSWVLTGKPDQFLADVAAFDAVTPKALLAAAKKYLVETNRTVLVIQPGGK